MKMRDFLADEPWVLFTDDGDLKSAFHFRVLEVACDHCHNPLISIAGLYQCPSCPEINKWLLDSKNRLLAYSRKAA